MSLYVGDLAPDVTEALLHDVFKKVGPVLSIRVCRDAVSRVSLGYAYVNFVQATDAERARETLNYHPIHGKPIRIMWCQKDPNVRKQGKGNIIIKNLHKTIDNPTLYDTFSQFGNILSCKVEMDKETAESKGYGFVHFESGDAAKQAIEKVDGMQLAGQVVNVQAFIPRTERIEHNKATFTNLEIKGFKEEVTEEDLNKFFAEYGEVKRVKLLKDRKNQPFAFLDYSTHEAATKAIDTWDSKHSEELCAEGAELSIKRSLTKAERKEEQQKHKATRFAQQAENSVGGLYVGNLSDDVTDDMLKEAFEKFGGLQRAQVMCSKYGPKKSRGFGFVCFGDAATAERARQEMNNYELQGRRIVVNRAQHRQRQSHLGGGFPDNGMGMYGMPAGAFPAMGMGKGAGAYGMPPMMGYPMPPMYMAGGGLGYYAMGPSPYTAHAYGTRS